MCSANIISCALPRGIVNIAKTDFIARLKPGSLSPVLMRLRGSYSCASSLPNGRMCIRYFCLSTSSVRSAIGMRSATLSGGVQMTA